ncbi:ABC-F family ATP-binding cassette domain-containing protein [Streptomyces mobaraensis NBRC 13819 = DSM 40847]|uniref:ABC transporter n=1 Tax=Streptomyces mobaraensis (strain ATCC 29032 / DSM 40847 / JCM 4168 / NBRC 13819 / NCIMB 11159 / IPCR 16-22) TaxID=1223523 RepID=M3CDI7_STRM1|nr:ABC-F family ATP-binding cassette domain-containing protein [Streptomyces mobaraensis]EMF02142.1 ABC transporter [Streptomyces mobaraensis NBRC 13819 = DSM 40847]QTT76676.1 ABC-F family ATP-binding cassette domain-containing protein [Streptomyces mobaraensis NBRC 13819 = DSM 40847]
MLTVRGVELRAAARLLLSDISFTVSPGDRVGLVGRNGAGKTTLMTVLAGRARPAAGSVVATGPVGFLAQDSRAADPDVTVTDRILSARGLDRALDALRRAEAGLAAASGPAALDRAMRAYARAEAAFQTGGGYAAEAEVARVAAGLGLPDEVLGRPVGTLSGGQRRRVELARILFAGHDGVLLLDEPTNHLDADSASWLRDFLRNHQGGLVLISHDTRLLDAVVNRVFHLDPGRATIDVHNTGWTTYLAQRAADERRRTRERANAERKAAALHAQADRMKARSATAVTARSMSRRADRMLAGLEPVRRTEKTARIRLPEPEPCGRVPLGAVGLAKSYAGRPVLGGVDLAVDRGSRLVVLGPNGAGKTTLLRVLAGEVAPDAGRVVRGHGLRLGYFAQEHDTLDPARTVRRHLASAAPHLTDGELRGVLGAFLFTGDDAEKPVGVLSGGEKTRLALAGLVHSGANVLLLDEPTNNLDPASRDEVLAAVGSYPGAVVMVTHDEGAVDALRPDRVLLLPDADEDLWSEEYRELVALS